MTEKKKKDFTMIHNSLIYHVADFGLNDLDFYIIVKVESHHFKKEDDPFPSNNLIAKSIGVSPKSIERSSRKMVGLGYLKRAGGGRKPWWNFQSLFDILKCYKTPTWESELEMVRARVKDYKTKTSVSELKNSNSDKKK
ncbi:helix-turn-helix domain-containing protein, partial [Desulfobacterota bacterium AH_259_B03_O07]|nr:helix-turn-helix domain-containing protein [Desulfobacterota bacterium AH_259_B03_O07]